MKIRRIKEGLYKTEDGRLAIQKPKYKAGHWARWPDGWSVFYVDVLLEEVNRHHRKPTKHGRRHKVRLTRVILATKPTLKEARAWLLGHIAQSGNVRPGQRDLFGTTEGSEE